MMQSPDDAALPIPLSKSPPASTPPDCATHFDPEKQALELPGSSTCAGHGFHAPRSQMTTLALILRVLSVILLSLLLIHAMVLGFPTSPLRSLYSFLTGDIQSSSAETEKINLVTHPTLVSDLDPGLIPTWQESQRLLIIGDIHGCSAELDALLSKVSFDPAQDHLILVGDLINKGPDSAGVVRRARELGASVVRGNHEDNLLRSAHVPRRYRLPRGHPMRMSDKKSEKLREVAESLSDEDYDWLVQLPVILRLGRVPALENTNVNVVHAGLVPYLALEEQDRFDVMHMRSMDKHFTPDEEHGFGRPWFEYWNMVQKLFKKEDRSIVVYGHDRKMGLQDHRWSKGLDTGCVSGDLLTGLLIDRKHTELVSVHCRDHRG